MTAPDLPPVLDHHEFLAVAFDQWEAKPAAVGRQRQVRQSTQRRLKYQFVTMRLQIEIPQLGVRRVTSPVGDASVSCHVARSIVNVVEHTSDVTSANRHALEAPAGPVREPEPAPVGGFLGRTNTARNHYGCRSAGTRHLVKLELPVAARREVNP